MEGWKPAFARGPRLRPAACPFVCLSLCVYMCVYARVMTIKASVFHTDIRYLMARNKSPVCRRAPTWNVEI